MAYRSLVTGAGGFIGANLVRALLRQGDEVHVFLRPGSSLSWRLKSVLPKLCVHEVDIRESEKIKAVIKLAKPERVFHLAHYGGNRGETDGAEIRRVIIDGTASLYEGCLETGDVRAIIHAGTSSEYGVAKEAMREDMPLAPHTEYGLAKAWATLYGQHLAREKKLPIVTMRLFAVYGPYEAMTRLVPAAILAGLRNATLFMPDPQAVRDFIHVDDCVAVMLDVADRLAGNPGSPLVGEVFNIGSGVQETIMKMAQTIGDALSKELSIERGTLSPRTSEVPFWQADMCHTQAVLGWKPSLSLPQGVAKTVEWFTHHLDDYDAI